jgi:hypothetical protein
MGSLSDTLLADGCALHIESIHGEPIKILSGSDAGKPFVAVRETESDEILASELGIDPRAKRILRFRAGQVPNLGSQDLIETDDGKKWKTIRRPDTGYLTVDFELVEIVAGKDT